MDEEKLEEEKRIVKAIINDNILRLKYRDKMTYREIEERSGISRQQMRNLLIKEDLPNVRTLIRIAAIFDITVCYLLTDHRYDNDRFTYGRAIL